MQSLRSKFPHLPHGATVCAAACAAGLHVPPDLTVSQWADTYRVLDGKMCAEPGQYRTSRTPYLRDIQDALSAHSPWERVILMKGSQVGATEAGNNWLGYCIHHSPGPFMFVEPRVEDARKESRQRIGPMIAATDVLRDLVAEPRAHSGDNTVLLKDFPGGFLALTGANSAAGFRRTSVRYLFLDEADGYPPDVEGEGDPVELAFKRTNTYKRIRKMFMPSTPTVKGGSRVETEYNLSDRRIYEVPCPHCGEFQQIIWKQIVWPDNRPDEAALECRRCHVWIEDSYKEELLAGGRWTPTAPGDGRRIGFHLSALYSPPGWFSWSDAVREKLTADLTGREALKVWTNTVLAETWEDSGSEVQVDVLLRHQHEYAAPVPAEALVLTCGVDVHDDRLELEVVGWGLGQQSWGIEYRVIRGDPRKQETWDELDLVLTDTWTHEEGYAVPISVTCIDSGHRTHEVYAYCRKRKMRRVYAVKGSGRHGAPVVEAPHRKRTGLGRRHLDLWWVGDDQASRIVQDQLAVEEPGPGYCHWPPGAGYGPQYFDQVTAMVARTRYSKGLPYTDWHVKSGQRNEAFDARKYALAALYIYNPKWVRVLKRHQRRIDKAAAQPGGAGRKVAPDPPSPPAPQDPASPAPAPSIPAAKPVPPAKPPKTRPTRPHRRKGGWATGWR